MDAPDSPASHDERTTRMKPGVVVLLAVLLLAAMVSAGYMVMCAYIAKVTGSTAGLADIGNAAALTAGFSVLAVVIRLGRWWR